MITRGTGVPRTPTAQAFAESGAAVVLADREKYDRYSGYVEPMVRPKARATTLKLVPRS